MQSPLKIILAPAILAVIVGALSVLFLYLAILADVLLLITGYFVYARYLFSPRGGNTQEMIRSLVLEGPDVG